VVSASLLGEPLRYTEAEIAGIMSARHFVEVRQTYGGPAPSETSRALDVARRSLDSDRQWLSRIRDALSNADTRLRERSRAL
jgi:argininosuccinate lyase